jgi:hypothetical protein
MDHVRYEYLFPKWGVDTTHRLFGMDHNRCVLCTRCVRVCWHIEGAGTKNVAGRGTKSNIITDLAMPWGESRFLHAMRQMRPGLSDRRVVPQRLDHRRDGARPRQAGVHRHRAREKKQWRAALPRRQTDESSAL